MSFDTTLHRKARRLPEYPVPPTLRPRLMDRLDLRESKPQSLLPGWKPIIAGVAAVAVVGFGIKASLFNDNALIQMNAATLQSNSWHFVGWQWKDGKKVHWEIWGRRNPAYYREELGNELTLGFPDRSIRLLPSTLRNKKGGVIYSVQKPKHLSSYYARDSRIATLAGTRTDLLHAGHPRLLQSPQPMPASPESTDVWQLDGSNVFTNSVLIDKKTHLPKELIVSDINQKDTTGETYGAVIGNFKGQLPVVGDLKATYNVPIPPELEQFDPPVDSTGLPIKISFPITKPGEIGMYGTIPSFVVTEITMRADSLRIDEEGNIRLKLSGEIEGQPFSESQLHLQLHRGYVNASIQEEKNQAAIPLITIDDSQQEGDTAEISVIAVEPISPEIVRSRQLVIQGNYFIPLYRSDKINAPVVNFMQFPGLSPEVHGAVISGQFKTVVPCSGLADSTNLPAPKPGSIGFPSSRFNTQRAAVCESMMRMREYGNLLDVKEQEKNRKQSDHMGKLAVYYWNCAAEEAEKAGQKKIALESRKKVIEMKEFLAHPPPPYKPGSMINPGGITVTK